MNTLERKVLELIGEDPDSPDVFSDISPIRDSINDAIQEIVMLTGGNKRTVLLPLRQEMGFYRLTLRDGYLGWISDAWLVNQRKRLEQVDLIRMMAHNPRWMQPNGSPHSYLPISTDVIGFYPKPGSDGDVVELTVVEIPAGYADDADRIKLRDRRQSGTGRNYGTTLDRGPCAPDDDGGRFTAHRKS